jgi:hypothetical protein
MGLALVFPAVVVPAAVVAADPTAVPGVPGVTMPVAPPVLPVWNLPARPKLGHLGAPDVAHPAIATHAISGTVTFGSIGLGNIEVDAYNMDGSLYDFTDTATNGTWSISALPGNYIISFYDATGTYGHGYMGSSGFTVLLSSAKIETVGSADITGQNVVLPNVAHIKGTVSHASVGLAGIEVDVWSTDGAISDGILTAADGTYSLELPAGSYNAYFYDKTGTYGSGYLGSSGFTYDPAARKTVTVAAADITGQNVVLPTALHVAGKVSHAATGLAGITVDLYKTGSIALTGTTDVNGDWSIAVVPGTTYQVHYWDGGQTYQMGWLGSSGFTTVAASAKAETASTVDVTGQDVVLPLADGHIMGNVMSGGVAKQGVTVNAYDTVAQAYVGHVDTDASGNYSLGLPAGVYDVEFQAESLGLPNGFWSGSGWTADFLSASTVTITSGDVGSKDVVIPAGFAISGVVTNGTSGIDGVLVEAIDSVSGHVMEVTWTLLDGSYSMPVAAGTYYVAFVEGSTYTSGYWSGTGFTADPAQKHTVVGTSANVPGINAVMPLLLGKPTGVTAVGLDGKATVAWAAPASNGGSAITGYTVTSTPGTFHCSTATLTCDVTGLANHTQYTFTVHATTALIATGPESDPSPAVTPLPGATFHTITPVRVLDSRTSLGAGLFHSRVKQQFTVATTASGVPATAVAVTGNVTVVGQIGLGYVTIAPSLTTGTQPGTSTINFPVGDIRANGVTVPLATGGKLDAMYWSSGSTETVNILFDVTGYFTADASGATLHTMAPVRVLDSRTSLGAAVFHSRVKQQFAVATTASGVPATATAVTGNVTVVGQVGLGYVTIAPSLTTGTQPGTSTINFPKGDIRANNITVQLATGGKLDAMYWSSTTSDTVNILFDVTGYFFNDVTGSTFHALTPVRVLDSRTSVGTGIYHSKTKQTLTVATTASGVPATAAAITGNVTVVSQVSLGYVSVAPSLTTNTQPLTSTINFPVGDIRANGLTVQLAASGKVDLMYWTSVTTDTTHVLLDVTGFYSN